MRIGLYGYTDKRPLLYTLIAALQVSGDVAVISPNRHLKRLVEGYSDLGHFGNVLICVTDWTPDEVWSHLEDENEDEYDHVIYDLTDNIVDDTDLNISVLGSEYEDGEEDLIDMLQSVDKVKLMYDGKSGSKEFTSIPISSDYLGSVEMMEKHKRYVTFNNKQLNQYVAKVLSKPLNLPPNTIIKHLNSLARKR